MAHRRAAWVTAEVDDEVSAGIRAGGDRTAAAGADALLSQVREARALLPELLDATAPDRPVLILWQGWSLSRTTSSSPGTRRHASHRVS